MNNPSTPRRVDEYPDPMVSAAALPKTTTVERFVVRGVVTEIHHHVSNVTHQGPAGGPFENDLADK